MKKLIALLLTAVMTVACFSLVACSENNSGDSKYGDQKIAALITLHGDSSTYDKNFIEAFKKACENKGLTEKNYAIVTNIPESRDCYEKAADFADQGFKAVFADSFGHEDFLIQAAEEYKDVQFYHATGTQSLSKNLSNFHNAFASIYEGRYLAGYAAGLKLMTMTEKADSNKNFKVGYVGAFTYAEVISGYTSWFLGLQAALTDGYTATMEVMFTGSWYTNTGEKNAAITLIDNGAVLLSQHADSMGAPTACETKNIPDVAYNGSTGKATMVAYSKINWVPYFEMMIDQATGGSAVTTDWTGTISTGSVQWALGSNVAEGTEAKVKAVEAELIAGTRKVFDCSKFTVDGNQLTTCKIDGQEVVKSENGITYFAESFVRSAPYFEMKIDGITLLNTVFDPVEYED